MLGAWSNWVKTEELRCFIAPGQISSPDKIRRMNPYFLFLCNFDIYVISISFNYVKPALAPILRHLNLLYCIVQKWFVVFSQTKTLENVNINVEVFRVENINCTCWCQSTLTFDLKMCDLNPVWCYFSSYIGWTTMSLLINSKVLTVWPISRERS